MMDNYFDVTVGTMKELFESIDTDRNGLISYKELRSYLKVTGFNFGKGDDGDALGLHDSEGITLTQFANQIQTLKLMSLFTNKRINTPEVTDILAYLNYCDYSVEQRSINKDVNFSKESREMFFLTDRLKKFSKTFVFLSKLEGITMERMAVKFRLHPLSVADVLDESPTFRPRVEKYTGHMFIIAPFIRFQSSFNDGDDYLGNSKRSTCPPLMSCIMYGCQGYNAWWKRLFCCCFRSSCARRGCCAFTCCTNRPGPACCSCNWFWKCCKCCRNRSMERMDQLQWGDLDMGRHVTVTSDKVCIYLVDHKFKEDIEESTSIEDKDDRDINQEVIDTSAGDQTLIIATSSIEEKVFWDPIMKNIQRKHTKVRRGDAHILLYHVFEILVNSLNPIVETYQLRLKHYRVSLVHTSASGIEIINKTLELRSDLHKFQKLVKPLEHVLQGIIEDEQIGRAVKSYLRGVRETLKEIIDETSALIGGCKGIKDEYSSMESNKMNRLMYVLTIFTTVFIPGQFITGLYGMK
jgi:Mg2+ and Co2+ transporter CorA